MQRDFKTYSLNTVKKAPRLVGDYEILFANDDNGDECCDDNDNVDDDDFFCMSLSAYYHNFCTWMVQWSIWVLWLSRPCTRLMIEKIIYSTKTILFLVLR